MTVGEKIKQILDEKGLKQIQLIRILLGKEEILGRERTNFSRYFSGIHEFPREYIIKASNFLKIDPKTLFMLYTNNSDFLLDKDETIASCFVPLIGKASCGEPKDYDLNGYEAVPIPIKLYKQGMYAVEAEGDSMSPKINHGEIVYCCPNQAIDNGKIVHYWLNGESGIKKYKINESGTIISLIPINSDYDIITIHCEENNELKMAKVVGRFDDDF